MCVCDCPSDCAVLSLCVIATIITTTTTIIIIIIIITIGIKKVFRKEP